MKDQQSELRKLDGPASPARRPVSGARLRSSQADSAPLPQLAEAAHLTSEARIPPPQLAGPAQPRLCPDLPDPGPSVPKTIHRGGCGCGHFTVLRVGIVRQIDMVLINPTPPRLMMIDAESFLLT
jgi:hypothetical protein